MAALLEAAAVAVHLQDVQVVGEPVEQSAGGDFHTYVAKKCNRSCVATRRLFSSVNVLLS